LKFEISSDPLAPALIELDSLRLRQQLLQLSITLSLNG